MGEHFRYVSKTEVPFNSQKLFLLHKVTLIESKND
jgi:hypothetical protein